MQNTTTGTGKKWRDVLPIHPAARRIPDASAEEKRKLKGDLQRDGLKVPVVLVRVAGGELQLLDGRHRLDLLEATGVKVLDDSGDVLVQHQIVNVADNAEAERLSLSLNVHRRHLNIKQGRDLIRQFLRTNPEMSDRQIAELVKKSPSTVGNERSKMEERGDVSKLDTRTDTKGRQQSAKKKKATKKTASEPSKSATSKPPAAVPVGTVKPNGNGADPQISAEKRKAAYADSDDTPPVISKTELVVEKPSSIPEALPALPSAAITSILNGMAALALDDRATAALAVIDGVLEEARRPSRRRGFDLERFAARLDSKAAALRELALRKAS